MGVLCEGNLIGKGKPGSLKAELLHRPWMAFFWISAM